MKSFRPLVHSKTLKRLCVYCGDLATCREHFECWSVNKTAYYLPACTNCNRLLGTCTHDTLGLRCEHIYHKLQRKQRSVLKADYVRLIEESTGLLQQKFIYERQLKLKTTRRLQWLDYMSMQTRHLQLNQLRPDSQEIDFLTTTLDFIHSKA